MSRITFQVIRIDTIKANIIHTEHTEVLKGSVDELLILRAR
ncbi:MAG: hypothetical protein ACFC03_02860 [Candidatus Malihini olakiniferum]